MKSITQNNKSPVNVFGLKFPNCIGQAAGLDKDGIFPAVSEAFGFGHVEVGTVTPKAQEGNDKPRLFRYQKEKALVNRMGFNNLGVDALVKRIETTYPKKSRAIPLGVNLGKVNQLPLKMHWVTIVKGILKYIKLLIMLPLI